MMVIGFKSGKEFVVKDNNNLLRRNDGELIEVFISEKGDRMITVRCEDIEYYNEANGEKQQTALRNALSRAPPSTKSSVDVI